VFSSILKILPINHRTFLLFLKEYNKLIKKLDEIKKK